jgi:hypothetical protein
METSDRTSCLDNSRPPAVTTPQRSFVASQENLLEAVESWVAEY